MGTWKRTCDARFLARKYSTGVQDPSHPLFLGATSVLSVSLVNDSQLKLTTEAQRTQRLHREKLVPREDYTWMQAVCVGVVATNGDQFVVAVAHPNVLSVTPIRFGNLHLSSVVGPTYVFGG